MKTLLKTMVLVLALTGLAACTTDEDVTSQQLEVTPNNVSGIWSLAEVNGEALPDGLYCYIEFVRRDRTFTMYQKFDSMYPRRLTGTYSITKDDYKGYVLDGKYDYGTGDWNNAYIVTIVTDLYEESMVLTADAKNGDVCKYVRCDEVPKEIIAWFESGDAE